MQPLLSSLLLLSPSSLFLFLPSFPVTGVIFEFIGQKTPAFSTFFTQTAKNFVRFVHSARYVYLCSCEGYTQSNLVLRAWLPKSAYPDKVNHELEVDYMHEGDTFKRNRPWFTPGGTQKSFIRGGSAPRSKPFTYHF